MDNFSEDFFSITPDEQSEPITEAVETEVSEPVEETVEPVEETVETETAEAEPAADTPKMVPLSAVQAERARAKEAYDQVEALRKQVAALEANKRSQNVPDPYDDPTAYVEHQQQVIAQQVEQAIASQKFKESHARAVSSHGQETLDAVAEWAQEISATDPTFEHRVFAQPDPVAWIIEQKTRSDMIKAFEADPDAYVRAHAAKLGLASIPTTEIEATPPAKKNLGPRSLAGAKSRDTATVTNPVTDAFDALFKK